jgi:hypothetical protein
MSLVLVCAPLCRRENAEIKQRDSLTLLPKLLSPVRARRHAASVLQRRKRAPNFDQRRLCSWTGPGYVVSMLASAFHSKNVTESR